MFLVYLVSTDESATILNEPLLTLTERPTVVTDRLLWEVVAACYGMNDESLPDDCSGLEALNLMRENMYSSENTIVIVREDLKQMLYTVGEALGRTMRDDSSCYAAAEAWGAVVIEHGLESFDL